MYSVPHTRWFSGRVVSKSKMFLTWLSDRFNVNWTLNSHSLLFYTKYRTRLIKNKPSSIDTISNNLPSFPSPMLMSIDWFTLIRLQSLSMWWGDSQIGYTVLVWGLPQRKDEKFGHFGECQIRAPTPPHGKEPVGWFGHLSDDSWAPFRWSVSILSYQKETKDMLVKLRLLTSLGTLWCSGCPTRTAGEIAGRSEV